MRSLIENWQKYVQEDVDPDTIDLSSFEIQNDLNQKVWVDNNEKMNPEIVKNLLEIVEDFWQWLEIPWVDILDIVLTGSLANYNWSRFSDIDLHIVVDDVDLPLGKIRVRPKGGDGCHRGMESVIYCLGNTQFPRLRFGVAASDQKRPACGGAAVFFLEDWLDIKAG